MEKVSFKQKVKQAFKWTKDPMYQNTIISLWVGGLITAAVLH